MQSLSLASAYGASGGASCTSVYHRVPEAAQAGFNFLVLQFERDLGIYFGEGAGKEATRTENWRSGEKGPHSLSPMQARVIPRLWFVYGVPVPKGFWITAAGLSSILV